MSIFQTVQTACPSCQASVPFELVHSVNAVRRPDLRTAILDRSFQRKACPSCGHDFRMAPEFTYLDVKRKQFFAVWPASKLGDWQQLEARAQATFDKGFGPGTDGHELAQGMQARLVFGWAGLNEKLVAAEAGIDDVTLELAKVMVMRSLDQLKVGKDHEFRLLGADAEQMALGWLRTSTEDLSEEFNVPRDLLAEIEAQPADWQALREQIAGRMFVDLRRPLFAKAA